MSEQTDINQCVRVPKSKPPRWTIDVSVNGMQALAKSGEFTSDELELLGSGAEIKRRLRDRVTAFFASHPVEPDEPVPAEPVVVHATAVPLVESDSPA